MCLVGGLVLVHNGQARRESTVLQFSMNTQLTHKPIVSYIFNRVALRRNSSDLSFYLGGPSPSCSRIWINWCCQSSFRAWSRGKSSETCWNCWQFVLSRLFIFSWALCKLRIILFFFKFTWNWVWYPYLHPDQQARPNWEYSITYCLWTWTGEMPRGKQKIDSQWSNATFYNRK